MLESGRRKRPSHDVMVALARALGMDIDKFYRLTGVLDVPGATSSVNPEDELNLMFNNLMTDLTEEERQSLREALEFVQWKRAQRRRQEAG